MGPLHLYNTLKQSPIAWHPGPSVLLVKGVAKRQSTWHTERRRSKHSCLCVNGSINKHNIMKENGWWGLHTLCTGFSTAKMMLIIQFILCCFSCMQVYWNWHLSVNRERWGGHHYALIVAQGSTREGEREAVRRAACHPPLPASQNQFYHHINNQLPVPHIMQACRWVLASLLVVLLITCTLAQSTSNGTTPAPSPPSRKHHQHYQHHQHQQHHNSPLQHHQLRNPPAPPRHQAPQELLQQQQQPRVQEQ